MSKKEINQDQGMNSQTTAVVSLDDEALQSVAGGCTSSCGGGFGSTPDFSCVPPGQQCP